MGANARLRTLFYSTLTKLLFLDDANLKFRQFIEPFSRLLRSLAEQNTMEAFTTPQAAPPPRPACVTTSRHHLITSPPHA